MKNNECISIATTYTLIEAFSKTMSNKVAIECAP
jgi:hypothetical protein